MTNKATRLPKRILGMKLPKSLRRGGGRVIDVASNPFVAALAAPAVIAGAIAAARSGPSRRAASALRMQAQRYAALAREAAEAFVQGFRTAPAAKTAADRPARVRKAAGA